MADSTKEALLRLAGLVTERRWGQLGFRQDQLAFGPSTTTMTQIEAGEPVSDLSYRKLEQSLGWEEGSCRSVLAGGDPAVVVKKPPQRLDPKRDLFSGGSRDSDFEAEIERALRRASGGIEQAPAGEEATEDEHEYRVDEGAESAFPELDTEGGRVNRQSLHDLIVTYSQSRDQPPLIRADIMLKALRRSIHAVRTILLRDEDRTVRANAIDALNPADAAITFLQQDLEQMADTRSDSAPRSSQHVTDSVELQSKYENPGTPTIVGPGPDGDSTAEPAADDLSDEAKPANGAARFDDWRHRTNPGDIEHGNEGAQ